MEILDSFIAVYLYELPGSSSTVIVSHGYLDHGRRSKGTIDFFLNRGFNVLAWDLPGHGNSRGERGSIDDFYQYAESFERVLAFAMEKKSDNRLVFLGQSLSCAVFLTWHREIWLSGKSLIKSKKFPLDKVVFTAPLVRSWLFRLSSFGWSIGRFFIKDLKPRTSAGSHRKGYSKLFFSDPLTVKRMPVKWVGPHRAWEKRIRDWKAEMLPILVIQGKADTVVDWRYNLRFLKSAYPLTDIRIIKGAWHCLLDEAEPWASQVFKILEKI